MADTLINPTQVLLPTYQVGVDTTIKVPNHSLAISREHLPLIKWTNNTTISIVVTTSLSTSSAKIWKHTQQFQVETILPSLRETSIIISMLSRWEVTTLMATIITGQETQGWWVIKLIMVWHPRHNTQTPINCNISILMVGVTWWIPLLTTRMKKISKN